MIRRRTFLGGLLGGVAVVSTPTKWGAIVESALAATDPVKGGSLKVGLHIPLPTLDWQSTVGHPLPHVMGHVFEGLFGLGKDLNAQPELAESVDAAPDGKTWTIKLRKGVKFHNGKTMNADDVVATCLLYTSPSPRDLSTSRMPSSA